MYDYNVGDLILSLIITLACYCAFPLLSANYRETEITKKKYTLCCFGVNFLVWIVVFMLIEATSGNGSSGAPYVLWTWVFSSVGAKKLAQRGLIIEKQETNSTTTEKVGVQEKSIMNCHTKEEAIAYFVDMYKGESDKKLGKILSGDYSEEAKTAVRQIIEGRNKAVAEERIAEVPLCPEESSAGNDVPPQIRFCRKCGSSLTPGAKYCENCGCKIE